MTIHFYGVYEPHGRLVVDERKEELVKINNSASKESYDKFREILDDIQSNLEDVITGSITLPINQRRVTESNVQWFIENKCNEFGQEEYRLNKYYSVGIRQGDKHTFPDMFYVIVLLDKVKG
ncbi:hypothetical protein [Candidatus Nitrosocosmicus franklandus]|uniref:Uncharacterized protein n=1 Tax=Candidatus Nitrosocosmicus franklandianus TaxID=1798806 RepID=A0A484I5M7_9ARCH|nr:hypothetical protein [Candidatus Nitrosocosmicus franklandus]VFJ12401.1 protein of unknown function [Candidatus Nitrosocosmicus franklandus]